MDINQSLEVLKTNILRWYKFKENSNILILGEDINELSNFLGEKNNITCLGLDNNYITNKIFDYIIIKDKISLLENFKKNLAEDGTILLLLNNRLGVTYFAGSDKFKTLFGNESNLLSKEEIDNTLEKYGFTKYKFYYPLPNYNFANAIYSDNYLPEYNDSKLANNNIYLEDNLLIFNEIELLKSFTKMGDFKKFTNSFLVEINPKSKEKAIFYNNNRKNKYRLITKIYDEKVEKECYTEEALQHLNTIKNNIYDLEKHEFYLLDRVEEISNNSFKLTSKFVTLPNLYKKVVEKIKNNQVEEAVSIISNKYNEIKAKFALEQTSNINNKYFPDLDLKSLFIVKKLYIDLTLENMFLDNEKTYIYDQEWVIEDCPLEFLLFRMINNIYMMSEEISTVISRDEMLKKFNLLELSSKFFEAEKIIQEEILNQEILKIYNKVNDLQITKKELYSSKENFYMLGLYKAENTKKEKYILELQAQIAELESKLKNNN